jgi:hypothetical protein
LRERATVLRYTYIVGLVYALYHKLFVSRDLLVHSVNGGSRSVLYHITRCHIQKKIVVASM